MKKLILLFLAVISLMASDLVVTLTFNDVDQAAWKRVQSRESNTNLLNMDLGTYITSVLEQSRTNVVNQERNADIQMLAAKLKASDQTTQDSVKSTLKIDSKDVIPADAPLK